MMEPLGLTGVVDQAGSLHMRLLRTSTQHLNIGVAILSKLQTTKLISCWDLVLLLMRAEVVTNNNLKLILHTEGTNLQETIVTCKNAASSWGLMRQCSYSYEVIIIQ